MLRWNAGSIVATPDATLRTEWITDRAGLASVIGVTPHHVHKLVTRGMPRAARGRYDVRECVQWYVQRLEQGGARDPDDMEEVIAERIQLIRAQRHRVELDNEQRRGELVEYLEAQDALLELTSLLTQSTSALKIRLARSVLNLTTEAEAIHVIERETNAIGEQLSQRAQALGERLSLGSPTVETEPETDGSAMGGRGANGTSARN